MSKFKTVKRIAPADTEVLDGLEEIANDKGFTLKTYDVSTLKRRLQAFRKGIKQTLTETHRIVGVPKEEPQTI